MKITLRRQYLLAAAFEVLSSILNVIDGEWFRSVFAILGAGLFLYFANQEKKKSQ